MLEKEITLAEVNEVVKNLPKNKCAGPDGFSAEYYKKFWDILAPMFLRMINHSFSQSKLPLTLYNANIVLIPKPGRDKM